MYPSLKDLVCKELYNLKYIHVIVLGSRLKLKLKPNPNIYYY